MGVNRELYYRYSYEILRIYRMLRIILSPKIFRLFFGYIKTRVGQKLNSFKGNVT